MVSSTDRPTAQLRRDIGIFGAAFLALNAMIGAGIFALPGKIAVNAGLLSPWLFLVVGALFITIVLTFAELSSYYDRTGGPVLYATDAFGPFAGFSTGWAIYLSRMTAFAANANVMATYLASLHDIFASDLARGTIITTVTVGLTWANVMGVRDGVRTMAVFTFLKVTPLVLMILLGLQHVTGATLIPGGPVFFDGIGDTTLLLIYAYVGFETLGVTAGETSQPRRTLPKAYVGSMLGTSLLYFFVVLVFVSIIPANSYEGATLVDVAERSQDLLVRLSSQWLLFFLSAAIFRGPYWLHHALHFRWRKNVCCLPGSAAYMPGSQHRTARSSLWVAWL